MEWSTDAQEVKDAYTGIFRTLVFRKITNPRRFAAGNFVFDDLIAEVHVVGNEMPSMPFPVGTTMNVRLVHCLELRDGQITREIDYEMWRERGGALDHDAIPVGAGVTQFPAPADPRRCPVLPEHKAVRRTRPRCHALPRQPGAQPRQHPGGRPRRGPGKFGPRCIRPSAILPSGNGGCIATPPLPSRCPGWLTGEMTALPAP